MTLYTSFSIYVTYVINLGRRQKHKKKNRRNFCKYVLNKVSLRGRINGTEGRLAGFLIIHIIPLVYFHDSATPTLKTIGGKETIK